jgi:hypothetical protein
MFYGIDIDGTIAVGGIAGTLEKNIEHYRERGIDLPETIPDFPTLLHHPDIIRLHRPISHAVEGVKYLQTQGQIGYFTIRKHPDGEREKQIRAATQQWLNNHRFPYPSAVTFCHNSIDKIIRIHKQEQGQPFALIDDRWQQAINQFDQVLCNEYAELGQAIKQCLILVAYGTNTMPVITNGLRVIPMASWGNIVDIDSQLVTRL